MNIYYTSELTKIVLAEYQSCHNKMLHLDGQANQGIGNFFIAIGAITAISGYAFKVWNTAEAQIVSFLLLAFGFIITNFLLLYVFHLTVQCFRLGGYIKYLESILNELSSIQALLWESRIAPIIIHKSFSTTFLFVAVGFYYFLSSMIVVYISVIKVWKSYWYLGLIICIFVCIETVITVALTVDAKKAHTQAYSICKQELLK